MFDGASAVQAAAYTALNVAALAGSAATVWAHLPEVEEGADPLAGEQSIVLVHDIALTPMGGKDGGLDQASLEIVTFIRQPDRSALSALQARVRDLLENGPFVAAGAILSQPVQVSAEGTLWEDGATYQGTQRFELFAQPA
jgi:hypothetical protein